MVQFYLPLHVSMSEQKIAHAFAPVGLTGNNQFFRPDAKDRMAFSSKLLSFF
jgi:hypothetical protein